MGILVEEQWETTLFYLATLSTVFILGCILRFLLSDFFRFIYGSFYGEERGGDENDYLEKWFRPHFNYLILKVGHIYLLYKSFYFNLFMIYKYMKNSVAIKHVKTRIETLL